LFFEQEKEEKSMKRINRKNNKTKRLLQETKKLGDYAISVKKSVIKLFLVLD